MKAAPILIIDKTGLVGEPLALKLSKGFLIVFVSKKILESESENKNIISIPFTRRFPVIPDNKYSHIIIIADEGEDLEFLPKIIEKAKGVNSDLIFAKDLSSKDNYAEKVLSAYSSSKIVLYGDIFDNKLIHRYEGFKSVINKFIYQAQKFGKIQILGDGLRTAYPVFINDVVDGLIDLVFGINDKHSLFYLFPKHQITELSLAHMIQKANPQISIDFIRTDPRKEIIHFSQNGKYLLEDKYPLPKKIKVIDLSGMVKIEEKESLQKESVKRKSLSLNILWIIIFLIFAPLIFTLLFSFLGLNTLYYARTMIDKGNFATAQSSLHLSNALFAISKKTSSILYFEGKIIGRENNLKRLLEDIDLGQKISQGGLQLFSARENFALVANGKSKNPISDFTKGQNNLKNAILVFEKLQGEEKIPALLNDKLKSTAPLIKFASNTIDILPSIFGFEGEKIYLVLFQNNMELRPGGGFIGSYGILKLNMGRIVDFSIHDVYDADGQLRGHVEPPFAIRKYLPSAHWYMRDSNFDVDFVKSASFSSNFLNIETHEKADGVIGVDVSFVKNILHAIGPVSVPDYKETVTDANLFELTETHSEKESFPGSTQKKDFLRSLYKAIQLKISDGNVPYFSVIQAISGSLSQKHLIFEFNNNWQNIFTVNGWSSSLWDERKESKNSINDFFGINEANLGVNKVNHFIKRRISQSVKVEGDGSLFGEVNLSYKNTSVSWPGGDYKNYLRIILPLDASISSISINEVSQSIVDAVTDFQTYEAKNFKPPLGLEVEKTIESEKTIYGFLVNIPVGELTKIKIQYSVARKNAFESNNFSYSLKIFKQPGIDNLPYSFSLYYPDNLNILKFENLKKEDGSLSYSENIVGDKELKATFANK